MIWGLVWFLDDVLGLQKLFSSRELPVEVSGISIEVVVMLPFEREALFVFQAMKGSFC